MTETQTHNAEQVLRRKLDLLLRTGKLLVESAADTNRIMRNMKRTAAFLGLPEEHLHIYVTYSMLMVNLSDEEHSFSKFQRCEHHGVNMAAIEAVSKLSWRAIREDYSLDRYEEELERIRTAGGTTRPGRWPSGRASPVAASASSSAATGLPSPMPPSRQCWASACAPSATSGA